MPIFEFKCRSCDIKVEEFLRSSKKPAPLCSECGERMERVVSSPASIIFKGTGYYTTDYGKGKIFKEIEKKEVDKKPSSDSSKTKTPEKTTPAPKVEKPKK